MPLKSKSQWRKFAKEKPELFKKWQTEHPVSYEQLPEKLSKRKKTK